jgi:hypothetical protein
MMQRIELAEGFLPTELAHDAHDFVDYLARCKSNKEWKTKMQGKMLTARILPSAMTAANTV